MLYHISINKLLDNELNFIPRVPSKNNRLEDENNTISRICFSDSVEGCLKAIAGTIGENVILKQCLTLEKIPIYVYGINETLIDNKYIKTPIELVENKYVMDAWKNSEYWITKEVKLNYIKTIYLDDEMQYYVINCDDEDIEPYINYDEGIAWKFNDVI